MITQIEIEGYKSIKSLSLDLEPINILLGANGAGKSNFISIFSLIRNIFENNLQNYVHKKGGANSLLYFGKKSTNLIKISLWFRNKAGDENKFHIELEAGQESLFIRSISTASNREGWEISEQNSNVQEAGFHYLNANRMNWAEDILRNLEIYHFNDTGDSSPIKSMNDINDNHKLKSDGSNIAAFLYYLEQKHPKHFKRIELTLKSIAPYFGHFVLAPNRLNENKIYLEWREKGHPDTYFDAYHLSDGTLRFICLITLLMQPNPPHTVIIDEPELGLHPVAVNKLASLIRKASEKSQIILSTQSINLLDNFDPEDIVVTDKEANGSTFRRLSTKSLEVWLKDYTLGDLWGQNKLGAQPY